MVFDLRCAACFSYSSPRDEGEEDCYGNSEHKSVGVILSQPQLSGKTELQPVYLF